MYDLSLIFFPAYDWAISPTHPEREERLLYTQDQLREEGIFNLANISEVKAQTATKEDVLKAHFAPLGLKNVINAPHLISAGGAIAAAKEVINKKAKKAFALVRPPGHHAMRFIYGGRGFCNLNNEAIMVEYLRHQHGIRKIAIIDTDCHHGDGSQEIYWHDPDILFISLHQDGRTLYPGSGFVNEMGGPKAFGQTINIPLPPQTGDEGFLWAAKEIIKPILKNFGAELIINSAGQDNHFSDPITNMNFTAKGYAQLSEIINPDIAVLEGGYAIEGALPYTNLAIILAMAGLNWQDVEEPLPNPQKLKTAPQHMAYLKEVRDYIFENKNKNPKNFKLENSFFTNYQQIHYDTHGVNPKLLNNYYSIEAEIKEQLYNCPNCSGYLIVEAKSNLLKYFKGFLSFFSSCQKCQTTAFQLYKKAQKEKIETGYIGPRN